jgi:hypothetical protein
VLNFFRDLSLTVTKDFISLTLPLALKSTLIPHPNIQLNYAAHPYQVLPYPSASPSTSFRPYISSPLFLTLFPNPSTLSSSSFTPVPSTYPSHCFLIPQHLTTNLTLFSYPSTSSSSFITIPSRLILEFLLYIHISLNTFSSSFTSIPSISPLKLLLISNHYLYPYLLSYPPPHSSPLSLSLNIILTSFYTTS